MGSLSIPATATVAGPDPYEDAAMQRGDGILGLGVHEWEHSVRFAGLEDCWPASSDKLAIDL